jgi:hypothetical protein
MVAVADRFQQPRLRLGLSRSCRSALWRCSAMVFSQDPGAALRLMIPFQHVHEKNAQSDLQNTVLGVRHVEYLVRDVLNVDFAEPSRSE